MNTLIGILGIALVAAAAFGVSPFLSLLVIGLALVYVSWINR